MKIIKMISPIGVHWRIAKMAMNNTKEQKAIHEVFPTEIRNEINDIRISLGMTWYEFLPYSANCAKEKHEKVKLQTDEYEEAAREKRM